MGCDIHFVIEKQQTRYNPETGDSEPTGRWLGVYATWMTPHPVSDRSSIPSHTEAQRSILSEAYERIPSMKHRNYDFFAKLAGVRGDGPPPRGLPPDISELAQEVVSEDDADLHSHSWATMEEFCEAWLLTAGDDITAKFVAHGLHGTRQELMEYVAGTFGDIRDYRVVYAFDN